MNRIRNASAALLFGALFVFGLPIHAEPSPSWGVYLEQVNTHCGPDNWAVDDNGPVTYVMEAGLGCDVCEVWAFPTACADYCENIRCPGAWDFGNPPSCSDGVAACECLCWTD